MQKYISWSGRKGIGREAGGRDRRGRVVAMCLDKTHVRLCKLITNKDITESV